MIDLKMIDALNLKKEIINYLKSKGSIRAVLFHKLLHKFCTKKSQIKVKKAELISCLIQMMKNRLIEIIIPKLFEIDWGVEYISDLIYLQDGDYFKRKFFLPSKEIQQFNVKDSYLFDSRTLKFKDLEVLKHATNWLVNIIKKYPKTKYKIMIYYPKKSNPLEIYGPFKGNYQLNFQDFAPPEDLIKTAKKFNISIEEQKSDLFIIQSFRKNYMCFYITLIESIQYEIMNLQKNEKNLENEETLQDLITKFGYYCILFVNSDWVKISEPNPYRWETYFISFKLPLKILNLEFKTIRFHKRTFECWIKYRYCIFMNQTETESINLLKEKGYQVFSDYSNNETKAIGGDHEIYIPCPSIEHFFFIFKYICYYHLFLLLHYSFNYLKTTLKNFKLASRDNELYDMFLPIMEPLFDVTKEKVSKRLVFSYYTLNPNELETLYNKFLVSKIRNIEKKLFNYFLLRCSI